MRQCQPPREHMLVRQHGRSSMLSPRTQANDLTIHIMAAVAQAERKAISRRTKVALESAMARGVNLGNPNGAAALARAGQGNTASLTAIRNGAVRFAVDLEPIVVDIMRSGLTSLRAVAVELKRRGIVPRRGGVWHLTNVRDLLHRQATEGRTLSDD